jgi:hypothetical protein
MLMDRAGWRRTLGFIAGVACVVAIAELVEAGENLTLAPGLSFTDDSSDSFPIRGEDLGAAATGGGRATIAFFGAAHCWNTNREAERLVALYPKFRDRMRFVVVDVNHPSESQRALMQQHYRGYIPTLVVFSADDRVLYSGSGETARRRGDTGPLEKLLADALGSP